MAWVMSKYKTLLCGCKITKTGVTFNCPEGKQAWLVYYSIHRNYMKNESTLEAVLDAERKYMMHLGLTK